MAEPDLYSILNVTKNASASEIKKVRLHNFTYKCNTFWYGYLLKTMKLTRSI